MRSVEYVQESEDEFREGLKDYVARDYRAAFVTFENLCNTAVLHHRRTGALLMAGKSLYELGRYQDAIPYFDKITRRFPQSKYVDDAHYGRAISFYRLSQSSQAVKDLLWIIDNSSEKKLLEKSRGLAEHLLETDLSTNELREFLNNTQGVAARALVTIAFARQELNHGDGASALEILQGFQQRYPNSSYGRRIARLSRDAKKAANTAFKVGVILPLSGYFREQGHGVLDGIKFAQAKNDGDGGEKIQLVVRDSEGSTIKAIRSTRELLQREKVSAIIGELESEISATIGALAADGGVPLIAPAATEDGVASVGSTVYQLNSDLERKGRVLAEYAIKNLGLRTFATLAPTDEYGQQMIASFSSTVDELGGRIIAQTWYEDTPEDLSRQFQMIREAAFHYDSTDVKGLIEEALKKGEELREKDIPVMSVDAFFMPVYAEDIKYVAPQLASHNIRTQILGGEYLDDVEVLSAQQVQRYINGAIFVSDFFRRDDDQDFREFRANFRLRMKKTPERWEVFGYDTFEIIIQAVNAGARNARELNEYLLNIEGYLGQKGKVSFKNNRRVNGEVNILQFLNGRIVRHQS